MSHPEGGMIDEAGRIIGEGIPMSQIERGMSRTASRMIQISGRKTGIEVPVAQNVGAAPHRATVVKEVSTVWSESFLFASQSLIPRVE